MAFSFLLSLGARLKPIAVELSSGQGIDSFSLPQ